MRHLRYLPHVLLLALCACITNPVDTLNKRYAVFESGYQAVLKEVDRLETSDAFKPETKLKVALALEEVNKARKVANLARTSGDIVKANTALDIASLALTKLQNSIPKDQKL